MVIRNGSVLASLFVVSMVILSAGSAEAGVVYTDETAFNNAVAGLGLAPSWTEDFESTPAGPVSDPLLIGGGLAQVVDGGNAFVGSFGATGNSWMQPDGSQSFASMTGPGGTGLGLQAISFDFGNEVSQTVSFVNTAGIDTSAVIASAPATTNFVGWVSTGSETVLTTQFGQSGGITLDNIDGFVAHAPEPGTFILFGFGAAGLFFAHRRRRAHKAK